MKDWKKWLISIAACIATTATLAACGGSSGSNDGGGDNSITSEQPNENECTVTFEICTDLKTNKVNPKTVEKGGKVSKPVLVVIGENPGNAEVAGWYLDPEYTTEWDFATDTVQGDMTLYAKWTDSHPVIYYLGEETETEFFRQLVKEGDFLQREDSLADGYRSDGFFADPEHTIPFDFTQPITEPTNVYIHRSEEIYFSGDMIARRFTPKAAMSGAGSTTGTITAETNDAGETYAKMNFGYSTAADPHMMLENVLVDITHSQKLRITFKNLGKAEALSLYFIIMDENGKALPGYEQFSEKTCVRYYYKDDEIEMDPNGEWATVDIDMAGLSMDNGLSIWGNAAYLNRLRFQSGYVSDGPDDLSNEVWVKSIEGIADDTYVGTEDSQAVQDMLVDDAQADTDGVAGSQEQVAGWIFPKNYNGVIVNGNTEVYNKTNGLLMYTSYRGSGSLVLNAVNSVNLDELTTLKIRLKNLGYATKLTLKYRNKMGRSESVELNIDSCMEEFAEYKLNLFGANDYEGLLDKLTITYESVGNDNAILFESIIFDEYESVQIPGFNFNDKDYKDTVNNTKIYAEYNADKQGTYFNVSESGAAYTQAYENYSAFGYKAMELNYVKAAEGVTALNVELTVDGVKESYRYELAVGETAQAISLPLVRTGYIESATFTFEGEGEVIIKSLKFTLDGATDIDFSNSAMASTITAHKWGPSLSFDSSVSAMYYPKVTDGDLFKYYPGVLYEKQIGEGNIPLAGKTKLSIVYQNRNTGAMYLNVALGLVDVSNDGWKTEISEPYAPQSGGAQAITIKSGMAQDEWAHLEIDLTKYKNIDKTTIDQKAIGCILVELGMPGSIYIRSISLIDGDSPEGDLTESFDVNYYVGNDTQNAAYTQYVEQNKAIAEVPTFSTGYKVLGYYTDATYTTAFDFTQEITQTTNIYVKISEEIYLDANYFTENFFMVAAAGAGSMPGMMEAIGTGEDSYLEMNFGYSASGDPHARYEGALDISKSQKLRVTFKYFGTGTAISMYFVAEDENGAPVGGTYVFDETKCVKYYFTADQLQMSADGEWATVEFDMAKATLQNGVSLWGTAKTLKTFRFQVTYTSTDANDLSNKIWIKSIEGVADETYTTVQDSEEVAGMLEDDSSTETGSVAATQEQVNGWIFPKNYANAEVNGCDIYDKANGLLMYTPYGESSAITLKVPEGVSVSLDDLTTLTLKLKNLGYGTTLSIQIKNQDGAIIARELTIDARIENAEEYKLNLFGMEGYSGELAEVVISYTSVGNDNAILFESVAFSEFESMQVVGVNFNDKNYGGAASTAQMEVSYDLAAKGTLFNVLESGASYTKTFTMFSTLSYKNIVLNYTMAEAGVTAVKVGVTIGGATQEYAFAVSAGATTASLPLTVTGSVQSISVTFEGTGAITLQNIVFALDNGAIDFSTSTMVNAITKESSWYSNISYSQETAATYYSTGGSSRAYLGALYSNGAGNGCIALTGKTKVVLVYQNRGEDYAYVNIGIGFTTITDNNSWKYAIAEVGSNNKSVGLKSNMAEDEWDTVEIDLTQYSGMTDQSVIDTKAASCVYLQVATTEGNETPSIYVRAISFI